jgi:energy-converting hydrogenase Eha subunit G
MYHNISKILGMVGGGIIGGGISFYLTTSGNLLNNNKKNYWEGVFSIRTLIVSSLGFLGGVYISSGIKTKCLVKY